MELHLPLLSLQCLQLLLRLLELLLPLLCLLLLLLMMMKLHLLFLSLHLLLPFLELLLPFARGFRHFLPPSCVFFKLRWPHVVKDCIATAYWAHVCARYIYYRIDFPGMV